MEDDTVKAIAGMLCITILEITALLSGINGVFLSASVAVIAAFAGYEIAGVRARRKE